MPSGCIILDDRTFFTRLGRLEYVVIAVAFSVLSYYKSIYLSCRFYRTAAIDINDLFIIVDYRQIGIFSSCEIIGREMTDNNIFIKSVTASYPPRCAQNKLL